LILRFKENKVSEVIFLTKPEANFYPIKQIKPEELRLKGFMWVEEKRPKSKEDW
jgi:hypothetical protein